MNKKLLKVAAYLKSQGLYKEAAQIKKIAIEFEEGRYITLQGKRYDLEDSDSWGPLHRMMRDVIKYDTNAQKYHGGPYLEKVLMDSPYADTNAELWGIGITPDLEPIFWTWSKTMGVEAEYLPPLIEHHLRGANGPKFDKRRQRRRYVDMLEFLKNTKYYLNAKKAEESLKDGFGLGELLRPDPRSGKWDHRPLDQRDSPLPEEDRIWGFGGDSGTTRLDNK